MHGCHAASAHFCCRRLQMPAEADGEATTSCLSYYLKRCFLSRCLTRCAMSASEHFAAFTPACLYLRASVAFCDEQSTDSLRFRAALLCEVLRRDYAASDAAMPFALCALPATRFDSRRMPAASRRRHFSAPCAVTPFRQHFRLIHYLPFRRPAIFSPMRIDATRYSCRQITIYHAPRLLLRRPPRAADFIRFFACHFR